MLYALLLTAIVGAVASASASAAGQWWVKGAVFNGEEATSGKQTLSAELSATVAGTKILILCDKASTTGKIELKNKDVSLPVKFTECKVFEPAGCTIPATLETPELNSELQVTGEKVYDKSAPNAGNTFFTVAITGCADEGSFKVTGNMRCEVSEPEIEAVKLPCEYSEESGSELKFGANVATFTEDMLLELTGGNAADVWSAKTK